MYLTTINSSLTRVFPLFNISAPFKMRLCLYNIVAYTPRKEKMAEKNGRVQGMGQKRCRERERGKKEKNQENAKSDSVTSSRKFLELMVHNKRLSVPKLIMSVHAGLISFPPFNKYVAMAIRHNFSTRREIVRAYTLPTPLYIHVYTRECAHTTPSV